MLKGTFMEGNVKTGGFASGNSSSGGSSSGSSSSGSSGVVTAGPGVSGNKSSGSTSSTPGNSSSGVTSLAPGGSNSGATSSTPGGSTGSSSGSTSQNPSSNGGHQVRLEGPSASISRKNTELLASSVMIGVGPGAASSNSGSSTSGSFGHNIFRRTDPWHFWKHRDICFKCKLCGCHYECGPELWRKSVCDRGHDHSGAGTKRHRQFYFRKLCWVYWLLQLF